MENVERIVSVKRRKKVKKFFKYLGFGSLVCFGVVYLLLLAWMPIGISMATLKFLFFM